MEKVAQGHSATKSLEFYVKALLCNYTSHCGAILPAIDQCAGTPGPPIQASSHCQKGCEGGERRRLGDIWATKVQGRGKAKVLRQARLVWLTRV